METIAIPHHKSCDRPSQLDAQHADTHVHTVLVAIVLDYTFVVHATTAHPSAYWVSAGFSAAFRRASSASSSAIERVFRDDLLEPAAAWPLSPS